MYFQVFFSIFSNDFVYENVNPENDDAFEEMGNDSYSNFIDSFEAESTDIFKKKIILVYLI